MPRVTGTLRFEPPLDPPTKPQGASLNDPTKIEQMDWTPERVQRFWDYESGFPQRYFTYSRAGSLVNRLRRHIGGVERALDLGCGRGYLTEALLEIGIGVAAADHSPESVAFVQNQLAGRPGFLGAFLVSDVEAPGEKFDAIFVIEVIEHLTDPALSELFERVRKLAAPGALVVMTTPNHEQLDEKMVFCPACNHAFHRWGHVRSWTEESLGEYVRSQGWEVITTLATNFPKIIPGRPWKSLRNRAEARLSTRKPHLAIICRVPA